MWEVYVFVAVVVVLLVALTYATIKTLEFKDRVKTLNRRLKESNRARERNRRVVVRQMFKIKESEQKIESLTVERDELAADQQILNEYVERLERERLEALEELSAMHERMRQIEKEPNYHGCVKHGFRLKSDAQAFARYLEEKEGQPMNVYACPQCREHFTDAVIYHAGHRESRAHRLKMAESTSLSAEALAVLRAKVAQ